MLDPSRLRLIVELDRWGTLTAVGEALQMSTSAVSQQLVVLEREAGVPLLERHGRRVRLTDAGALLVEHGHTVLGAIEAAEADLDATLSRVAGRVRIGAFFSAARSVVPPAVDALQQSWPDLHCEVAERESHDSLAALSSGDLDVAVIDVFEDQEGLDDDDLTGTLLLDDPVLAVLPTGHPLADLDRVRLRDLADQSWAMEMTDTHVESFLRRGCRAAGFDPQVLVRYETVEVGLAFVEAGLAVAVIPSLALSGGPDVVQRPLRPEVNRQILAVTRRSNRRRPAVAAVIDALRAAAA